MASRKLPPKTADSFLQNLGTLRALPHFFRLIWTTTPRFAISSIVMRLTQSAILVALLYIGKLIIDHVVAQTTAANPDWPRLWWLIGAEFGLVLLSDALGRIIALTDSLIVNLYSNRVSIESNWANASQLTTNFPAVNGRKSRWHGPIWSKPRSSCWTNRQRPWMPNQNTKPFCALLT